MVGGTAAPPAPPAMHSAGRLAATTSRTTTQTATATTRRHHHPHHPPRPRRRCSHIASASSKKSKDQQRTIQDVVSGFVTAVTQGYFQPNAGGANIPQADGLLSDLVGDEPLFKPLYKWFLEYGGVFRLAFGPKCFVVVSDPIVARHILKENAFNYDKGVLAEILKPIMGKGLIPADLETWKPRRRAVTPGFHKAYIDCMVDLFGACALRSVDKLDGLCDAATTPSSPPPEIDMETEFLNIALDIIGLGIFNYDFGSVTSESPAIRAVYDVLREAEHRSTFYLPYWNLPLADVVIPRQRLFKERMQTINGVLDELIAKAQDTQQEEDLEALQNRDYKNVQDPSLLRFLVDMRGEDSSAQQLRDDLMTMLIAGHETTAAVLTWALQCLVENPDEMQRTVAEVDRVLGAQEASGAGPAPGVDAIREMKQVRMVLTESLRMFPQPPILIRRALGDDTLPPGLNDDPAGEGYDVGKGADLFISVWNLHRSPYIWKDPDAFRPGRYDESIEAKGGWAGFGGEVRNLYPSELEFDYAFIPFGGGPRKCIGDQFAMMEAAVILSMLLRRFTFRSKPGAVPGMKTGATIHTANGLWMQVERREGVGARREEEESAVAAPS